MDKASARAELHEMVKALAEARGKMLEARVNVLTAKAALEAVPEYIALENSEANYKKAKEVCAALEQRVREAACELYRATGDKHPVLGINIRVVHRLDYQQEALVDWLAKHAPHYLEVSKEVSKKKVADGLVAIGAPLTLVEEPQATISAEDLVQYLPSDGEIDKRLWGEE